MMSAVWPSLWLVDKKMQAWDLNGLAVGRWFGQNLAFMYYIAKSVEIMC
jgi:hypothetical protein